MDYSSRERGSILLYSLLTLAVMLAIGVTMGSLFVSKFKTATAGRETITALSIADSAIELCLYEARRETPIGGSPRLVLQTGATFTLTTSVTTITADCSVLGSKSFQFRATGSFRNTTRALEVSQ